MYSNRPWPLLWQRALSRSLWSNYLASYEVVKVYMDVLGQCLDTDVNIWIRQNEKNKRTFYSSCIMLWLSLDILHGWRSLSSSLRGRKLVFAIAMWQRLLIFGLRSRDVVAMEFVFDNETIEAWNVASSQLMEFVVAKCWLVVQQRCRRERGDPCTLTI